MLRYPQRYRMHWQLWSGGTTRLLLWGDPEYVRRFAGSARLYGGNSFEVNEMLATKMGKTLKDPVPGRSGFQLSSGMTLKTRSVAQAAVGAEGLWTTALAAAVLIA